jgi:selenocysteine lyase/cysteine desulfurase
MIHPPTRSRALEAVRKEIIGRDLAFRTPYGFRHMFYADYTASGRSLASVEEKMLRIARSYANTHTEDDYSGKYLTRLFHGAERRIKQLVNAGKNGKIFVTGFGSTGALKKLQEIIGVSLSPVTRERLFRAAEEAGIDLPGAWSSRKPVVFIGPYEHHTNEIMWREALADVVVVGFGPDGGLDVNALGQMIADPAFRGRPRFGSFSAGSNITGIRTRVHDVARVCHLHGVPVFFDYAAVAPYVRIDMNRDSESYFDAIFFSPHKFLGGPGSCGVLVMNARLYRSDLPPTTAGGGTVVYVGPKFHDYSEDIETRESAGTPPILQTLRAALAMEVKERIGIRTISVIEAACLDYFLDAVKSVGNLRLIGRYDSRDLTPIVSFNIAHGDRILHPKFVTRLLNDLFGVQSRAGCSCAGPYGHTLLDIDDATSLRYRDVIACGWQGLKPGWVRINLHYTFMPEDLEFLVRAIRFVASRGALFLRDYVFDFRTGEWTRRGYADAFEPFSADSVFSSRSIDMSRLEALRKIYFWRAQREADAHEKRGGIAFAADREDIESLKYFYYVRAKGLPPRS